MHVCGGKDVPAPAERGVPTALPAHLPATAWHLTPASPHTPYSAETLKTTIGRLLSSILFLLILLLLKQTAT